MIDTSMPLGIQSLADTDLYKLTMQQAVLKLYPDAIVTYRFKNRGKHKFDSKFAKLFRENLEKMQYLQFSSAELKYLSKMKFFHPWYLEFLRGYRFDPSEVTWEIRDGELELSIDGPWYRTILWEVPLMALISEIYFQVEKEQGLWNMEGQEHKLELKENRLMSGNCRYADFGTRRRRCFEIQDTIVSKMKGHHWFAGTSNVHLACKYEVRCIGTMAHEWIQGISALESMNHPNRFMMEKWIQVYGSQLGVALTDTYGRKSFYKDFNKTFASIFDGTRQDSEDPYKYTDDTIEHYKSIGIDYGTKSIVFSNALNPLSTDPVKDPLAIKKYCDSRGIQCSFGIGTSFTNDFNTPALNMVIKLYTVNGHNVVKLSDEPEKANGDPEMVEIMKKIHL